MRRLLSFLFPRFFPPPVVRWEDGVVHTDPRYAAWYAEVVERIRAVRPDAIQTPEMRVTVRLYERFPAESQGLWGRVLAPNVIRGDTGGTLCLRKAFATNEPLIRHEMCHAITGISDHPSWLFGDGLTLNV
jgi:hypothetical protein